VPLDLVIDRPVLDVRGTVTENTVALPGRFDIQVTVPTDDGPQLFTREVTADAAGAFVGVIVLPEGATSARVDARVSSLDEPAATLELNDLVAGTREVALPVEILRPILAISGVIVENGAPRSGNFTLSFASPPSLNISRTVVADADGEFDLLFKLPPGSTIASLDAYVNGITEPVYSETLAGLTSTTRSIDLVIDASRPVLTVTGVVTENDVPRPGPISLRVTPAGASAQTRAVVADGDGRYNADFDLAPGNTTALVEAFVAGIPGAVASDTVSIEPGPNSLELPVSFARLVSLAIEGTFTIGDGQAYTSPTAISLRRFDADDSPIGLAQEIAVTPNGSGVWTTALDVSPETRRVEIAWVATAGPAYESFDVEPGANAITADATTTPVTVTIGGRLTRGTEGADPFVDSTELRVFVNDRKGGIVSNQLVAVSPDGSGAYTTTVELDPHARSVDVSWPFAASAPTAEFAVTNGDQSIVYDANYDPGPATLRLRGIATVGGDPWPGEIEFTITYRRSSGSFSSRVVIPITPDPETGAFDFTDSGFALSVRNADVVAALGGTQRSLASRAIATAGTTIIDMPLEFDGRGLVLSGVLSSDGAPVAETFRFRMQSATEWLKTAVVTPDATGAFDVEVIIDATPSDVVIEIAEGQYNDGPFFEDFLRQPGSIEITGGVTSVSGLDYDITPPVLTVSGVLTETSGTTTTAITRPVVFDVTWTKPAGSAECCWYSSVEVTPGTDGAYNFDIEGPVSAVAATVVADLAALPAERTATVAPLVPGANAAPITVDAGVGVLVVSGTAVDRGEPFGWGYPATATLLDAAGAPLGSFQRVVDASAAGGDYSIAVPLVAGTASVQVEIDFNAGWSPYDDDPLLVFNREFTGLDSGVENVRSWDIATNNLLITGAVATSDGVVRADGFFGATVTSYSGGTGGTLLGVGAADSSLDGNYEIDVLIPDGTDTVVFAPDLSGVAPIVFTGLTPGGNARAAALITDPYQVVTVTGSITADGVQPTGSFQIDLTGYRRGATGRLEPAWWDYSGSPGFTGSDGSIEFVLPRVPPEVDVLEYELYVPGASGPRGVHYRYLELVGPGPHTLDVDIDQSSNRLSYYGLTTIEGTCDSAGQSFGFVATVLGYAGADDPAPVILSQRQVLSTVNIVAGSERSWHWRNNVAVPAEITHVQALYTTAGALDPNGAVLDVTGSLVEYPGGELDIDESFTASCAP
jgi:hypothetical protein